MPLKESLLKILQKKPIAKVTIKELCEEAHLNRGTFYLHYCEPNDEIVDTVITGRQVSRVEGEILTGTMDAHNTFDEPDVVKKQKFSDVEITDAGGVCCEKSFRRKHLRR